MISNFPGSLPRCGTGILHNVPPDCLSGLISPCAPHISFTPAKLACFLLSPEVFQALMSLPLLFCNAISHTDRLWFICVFQSLLWTGLYPPEIPMLKLSFRGAGIWRWGLWDLLGLNEVLRVGLWPGGIAVLSKEAAAAQHCLCVSTDGRPCEDAAGRGHLQAGTRALVRNRICRHLDHGLQPPELRENQCGLATQIVAFCYGSWSRLRRGPAECHLFSSLSPHRPRSTAPPFLSTYHRLPEMIIFVS